MTTEINGIVYYAECVNEKKGYVGITRRGLQSRIASHNKSALAGHGGDTTIWGAIRRFGIKAFDFRVLERTNSLERLAELERRWISHLDTLHPKGYNQNRGGSVAPYRVTHIVEGKSYRGAADLADAYGIYVETVRKRLQAGWSANQAVGIDPAPEVIREGVEITVKGKTYKSERELCRAFNIPNNLFRARYHANGWSLEEALELEPRANPNQFEVAGTSHPTFVAACSFYDLPKERVRSRLAKGWTVDEAFELTPRPTGAKKTAKRHPNTLENDLLKFPLEVAGKTYRTISELANGYGIKAATLAYRIRAGWSLDEAIGRAKKVAQGNVVELDGVEFASLTEVSRAYDVPLRTLNSRLRYGWTLEQAVGLVERSRQPVRLYRITHPDGQVTVSDNLSAFCRDHSLPSVGNMAMTASSDKHHSYRGYSVEFLDD